MKYALLCLKHRFLRKTTIAIILLGIFLIGVSWFTRSFLSIQDYMEYANYNHPYWQEMRDTEILSAAAHQRYFEATNQISRSNAFSFYAVMNNGFLLYTLIGNLLVGIAALSFFQERKSNFLKMKLIRNGDYNRSILGEAFAVSLTGWLYALIPSLIVWLAACILCPYVLPQGQSIDVLPHAMLNSLFQGNTIVFAYLIEIFMNSLQFIFTGLLVFALSLIVHRGIVLLFIPVFYVIMMNFVTYASGYTMSFYIMGAPQVMSYAPLLFACFYTFVLALIIFRFFTKKENAVNV